MARKADKSILHAIANSMEQAEGARCTRCREMIPVRETFAHGDQIKCGACGTAHRVLRRGVSLQLVAADVTELKESLERYRLSEARLERELREARAALGIGANGFVVGVLYLVWSLVHGRDWTATLLMETAGIAVGTAVVLELLNYLFLAKRRKIKVLTAEIKEARRERAQLERKLKDARKR